MNAHKTAVTEFARELEEALDDTIEWIDSPFPEARTGVDAEETTTSNAFHVEVGVKVGGLEIDDVGEIETDLNRFADERGVAVDLVNAGEDDTVIYRFALHAMFMDDVSKPATA